MRISFSPMLFVGVGVLYSLAYVENANATAHSQTYTLTKANGHTLSAICGGDGECSVSKNDKDPVAESFSATQAAFDKAGEPL